MPWEVKQKGEQYCVFKEGASSPIKGGCHDERADAVKQMKALYANMPRMHSAVLFSELEDDNVQWIQAWRYSKWNHPVYGEVEITPEFGQILKENFDARVYGQEIMVDYEHGLDQAKGLASAGDILSIEPRDDGVWYQVAFTDDALKEIKDRKWKYFSPEYAPELLDAETEKAYENVPVGGALSNRPFFKGMAPLNFSELFTEVEYDEETLEEEEGGIVDDLTRKFAAAFDIELTDEMSEDEVLAKATELNALIEPLRKAKEEGEKTQTFREMFPDEYAEHQRLKEDKVERDALSFSEQYSRFTVKDGDDEKKSPYGFSQKVKDKIAEVHRKFSNREVAKDDLKELLDLIGDNGIVDYSERGSARLGDEEDFTPSDPTQAFSQKITELMETDSLDYEAAMNMARVKFPDLYDGYKSAVHVIRGT